MSADYSTIQQHQPLRVPRNWNTQEKALIVQLDEVFDDIYRRFGRLRIEDMGKSFRKRFEDAEGAITEFEIDISGLKTRVSNAEGNITTLTIDVNGLGTRVSNAEGDIADLNVDVSGLTTRVTNAEGDIGDLAVRAGNIEIAVGNKYDKISGITIDLNGIAMTGKNITLNAGSSVDIKTGGTFTVQSGQFAIDANGNASFAGALNAATGTFAGTLSASCITSGTMSANRISGGTIDATNVTINNLDASKITSGTMSANKISGGTLTLGGSNNTNGTILIKDANGVQIGKWDKDGLSAIKGTFSGNLDSAGGTFSGNLSAAGGTFKGSVVAGEWTIGSTGILNEPSGANEAHFQIANVKDEIADYTGIYFDKSIHPQYNKYVGRIKEKVITYDNNGNLQSGYFIKSLNLNTGTGTTRLSILSSKGDGGTSLGAMGNRWDIYGYWIHFKSLTGTTGSDITSDEGTFTDLYYTNIYQTSSRDIKHNIHMMKSVGDKLDALKPVSFVYDNDENERTRYGLIYEETVGTVPEICTGSEENKAINYIELIPMLLKEIQELRTRVSDLEGRN